MNRIGQDITPIYAYIESSPAGPSLAKDTVYGATVFTPDGQIPNQTITRPVWGSWPGPLRILPLPRGAVIPGYEIGGVYQWWFHEPAAFGPCGQGAGAASAPATASASTESLESRVRKLEAQIAALMAGGGA